MEGFPAKDRHNPLPHIDPSAIALLVGKGSSRLPEMASESSPEHLI
jgi:hypothetical protein